jgi:iron complex transport system substrate-binding protein
MEHQAPLAERQRAPFPRVAAGSTRVLIAKAPQRIVAASVFSTEVLTAIAPRERIAAVIGLAADERYCAVASKAKTYPLCGAEPEQLLSQTPDLVVTDPFTAAETRYLLAQVHIPVLEIPPLRTLEDVTQSIRLLGWAIGCDDAAEQLAADTEARREQLRSQANAASAWRVLNLAGATSTYGCDTLLDSAITATGAINLASARRLPSYHELDIEQILGMRPDALLMSVPPDGEAKVRERLRQMPGMQLLPCVQQDRIVFVPGTAFNSTSHHILTAAEGLQRQLLAWGKP